MRCFALTIYVGVRRAGYKADSHAHIPRWAVIYKGNIACRCTHARVYKSDFFIAACHGFSVHVHLWFGFLRAVEDDKSKGERIQLLPVIP